MGTKSLGSIIRVSTAAAAADNITGITNADPGVVSAASHGIPAGAIVVLSSVGGMTQVNNRAFVVANPASGTFELKGIKTTGYGVYTSGGTAVEHTMTPIGELVDAQGMDGEADEVDVSHMLSVAHEFERGLDDFGQATFDVNLVSDAGQRRIVELKELGTKVPFSITLPNGLVAAFMGVVKKFSFALGGVSGKVSGQITVRISNGVAWFA